MYDAFDGICKPALYVETLPFPPPYMSDACKIFMNSWEEKLENFLYKQFINSDKNSENLV